MDNTLNPIPSWMGTQCIKKAAELGDNGALPLGTDPAQRGWNQVQTKMLREGSKATQDMLRPQDRVQRGEDGKTAYQSQPADGGMVNFARMRELFA